MPLEVGSRVGPYTITSHLGEGGMGVVFRARDTKLGRDVAIKALPESFSTDRERLQRFLREAQVLAALNHPNIAHIYGLEDSTQPPCIAMELIEGATLAEKLKHGPIPLNDALHITKQIAEALEAAHERGIIHRDLKPGNVMVLPDGNIKVLDFGLAKVHETSTSSASLSHSPTMMSASMPGTILGTAAYMSPEQAKGLTADVRSDLFSLGCILFEMLTGRRAFEGDTVSDVLASVLKTAPDLNQLPTSVNTGVRKLLTRCLEKNPKNRWHAAADIRLELQTIDAPEPSHKATPSAFWKRAVLVAVSVILGVAIGAIARRQPSPTLTKQPVVRLSLVFPENRVWNLVNRPIAISPDGTQIVYQTGTQLYLRSISELEGKPIAGAEDAIATTSPVFSPHGDYIAYWSVSSGSLKKIPTAGGTAVTLTRVDRVGLSGIEWTQYGILFGQGFREIALMSENGGNAKVLYKAEGAERVGTPHMLPGGKSFLFSTFDSSKKRKQIVVQPVDSSTPKVLMDLEAALGSLADARYLSTGHILYIQGGVLSAVPFDLDKLEIGTNPVQVVQGVRISSGLDPLLSISDTGTLLYIPGPTSASADRFTLALANREGALEQLQLQPGPYQTARVSPDGKRIAFTVDDATDSNIWLYDRSRGGSPSRLTYGGKNSFPVWSTQGDRIAFSSDREGDVSIFSERIEGNGQVERLTTPEKGSAHIAQSWAGDTVLYLVTKPTTPEVTLWMVSVPDKKVSAFGGVVSVNPLSASFSPNGKWVAYNITEPGKNMDEIYVQPFPATGAKYQLPIARDNHHPAWSRDGTSLFYIPGPGEFASISVTTTPFAFGNPTAIKQALLTYPPGSPRQYDVMPDGRLLGQLPADQDPAGTSSTTTPQVNVVLNWFEELKQRLPAK